MSLWKNKKGLDYSAFMVLVVLIVMLALFLQLNSKLDVFGVRVGDNALALLESYYEGEKLVLFVDQSARYSVFHALSDMSLNGGFIGSPDCGFINDRPYWFRNNKKCYDSVDWLASFEYYFSEQLDAYFSLYSLAIPEDNYEFTVSDDSVIGIPVRPVFVPIWPCAEKKADYAKGALEFTGTFGISGLGAYAVRPSFKLDTDLHLDDFDLLLDKVDVIIDCVNSVPCADDSVVKECVDSASSDEFLWALVKHVPGTKSYLFHVKLNNLDNSYVDEPVFVRFALEFSDLAVASE